jgi:hypothetical protein
VFPLISSGANSTTILPNQTFEVTSSVTIVGDLVITPEGTVKIKERGNDIGHWMRRYQVL